MVYMQRQRKGIHSPYIVLGRDPRGSDDESRTDGMLAKPLSLDPPTHTLI